MPTFRCYVADLNRSDEGGAPAISDFSSNGSSPGDYFQDASGNPGVSFQFDWSRRGILQPLDDSGLVSTSDLYYALPLLLQKSALGSPPSVALLLADRFAEAKGLYGVMFDMEGQDGAYGVRQGCALFVQAIWSKLYDLPDAESKFQRAVSYMATHELGHMLNLWHEDDGDTSFMQPHPDPETLGDLKFNSTQCDYLALAQSAATARFVLPGVGVAQFGELAPGYGNGSDGSPYAAPRKGKSAPLMRISLSVENLWAFEPIELDLTLETSPDRKTALKVPDEIDPSRHAFEISIKRPDRSTFLYRPQASFCGEQRELTLKPGKPFRRDISIGRQSGGFTFQAPGIYEIQALLRLRNGRIVESNTVCCEVLAPQDSSQWHDLQRLMTLTTIQRTLRFKRHLPPEKEYSLLAELASNPNFHSSSTAIHYALGRALAKLALSAKTDFSKEAAVLAKHYLGLALQSSQLGIYRSLSAESAMSSLKKKMNSPLFISHGALKRQAIQ